MHVQKTPYLIHFPLPVTRTLCSLLKGLIDARQGYPHGQGGQLSVSPASLTDYVTSGEFFNLFVR